MSSHIMAMGNLNKSKETKPTTNTALKLEDHYPKELKFPLRHPITSYFFQKLFPMKLDSQSLHGVVLLQSKF